MRKIFVNLPVKDLARSRAFFSELGFGINEQFSDETAACVVVEENIFVMLLTHAKFAQFSTLPIADAEAAAGALVAFSAESREAVSAFKQRALQAGARPWKDDIDLGFMFGASLQDPDGHVWEVFWMDPAAAAAGPPADAAA